MKKTYIMLLYFGLIITLGTQAGGPEVYPIRDRGIPCDKCTKCPADQECNITGLITGGNEPQIDCSCVKKTSDTSTGGPVVYPIENVPCNKCPKCPAGKKCQVTGFITGGDKTQIECSCITKK